MALYNSISAKLTTALAHRQTLAQTAHELTCSDVVHGHGIQVNLENVGNGGNDRLLNRTHDENSLL
jgi:hypothetical protein